MLLASALVWSIASLVTTTVDWPTFLARHDMTWRWEWAAGAAYTLQPVAEQFSHCGKQGSAGSCCFEEVGGSVHVLRVSLAPVESVPRPGSNQ